MVHFKSQFCIYCVIIDPFNLILWGGKKNTFLLHYEFKLSSRKLFLISSGCFRLQNKDLFKSNDFQVSSGHLTVANIT